MVFGLPFFRDGIVILIVALGVGGWWYGRNALLYHNPLTVYSPFDEGSLSITTPSVRSYYAALFDASARTANGTNLGVAWSRLRRELLNIEYTFWANQARIFISPIGLDNALIWWGRISLGLLAVSCLIRCRSIRADWPALLLLLSWPVTFLFLLVVYWSPKTLAPFGRFLFPALAPTIVLLVIGWHYALSPLGRRPAALAMTLSAGTVIVTGLLIPFVSLYPFFHPSREWQATQVQYPVDITYVNSETGGPVTRLIGYNLPRPYASPGDYFPIELCWEPLGRTDAPYAVFVQLLDVSQLEVKYSPDVWARRELCSLGG